jgi:hypothetical protein
MPEVDLETAIAQFLSLGKRLQADSALSAERSLDAVAEWYRDTRVTGALLDEDGDMLLLQWGATRPVDVSEPTDLRRVADGGVRSTSQKQTYIDVTRQIHARTEDEEEFDDSAVQLSVTLCYGPSSGNEPGSNMWIGSPNDLGPGLVAFRAVAFVRPLLSVTPTRTVITAGLCG